MILLLLYRAAVTLQIKGPIQRLLRNLLVPTAPYEFFIMPKHLSIKQRLTLNVLCANDISLNKFHNCKLFPKKVRGNSELKYVTL